MLLYHLTLSERNVQIITNLLCGESRLFKGNMGLVAIKITVESIYFTAIGVHKFIVSLRQTIILNGNTPTPTIFVVFYKRKHLGIIGHRILHHFPAIGSIMIGGSKVVLVASRTLN